MAIINFQKIHKKSASLGYEVKESKQNERMGVANDGLLSQAYRCCLTGCSFLIMHEEVVEVFFVYFCNVFSHVFISNSWRAAAYWYKTLVTALFLWFSYKITTTVWATVLRKRFWSVRGVLKVWTCSHLHICWKSCVRSNLDKHFIF